MQRQRSSARAVHPRMCAIHLPSPRTLQGMLTLATALSKGWWGTPAVRTLAVAEHGPQDRAGHLLAELLLDAANRLLRVVGRDPKPCDPIGVADDAAAHGLVSQLADHRIPRGAPGVLLSCDHDPSHIRTLYLPAR